MPEYSGLFRKIPVNASGMDFTLKCRHFPNPGFNEYLLEIYWGKHTFFGIENHLNVPKSRIDILFDTRGSGSV